MAGQDALWPWLQSIIGNQGAANPMDPHAIPAAAPPYMPGAGVIGMPAMTPGGPSMGFPAQTNPFGGQPPQPQPVSAGNDGGFNNPMMAAANAPMVPGAALGQGGIGSDARFPVAPGAPTPMGQGGIGSDARFPLATPPAGSPSAPPRPADSAKGPLASSSGSATAPMKRTPGAPNLGYYQGNPRFGTVQYNVPGSGGGQGGRSAPIYTALNLFGGGQPGATPAVNPNVPAANAQPVSANTGSSPGMREIPKAPDMSGVTFDADGNPMPDYGDPANWGMGPLQQGRNWTGWRPFKGSASSQGG